VQIIKTNTKLTILRLHIVLIKEMHDAYRLSTAIILPRRIYTQKYKQVFEVIWQKAASPSSHCSRM